MNTVQAALPLGMYLFFPDGASLNENGVIQMDSNASLAGGVAPEIRVPLNEDTVARAMAGGDVQLTYALAWLDGQQDRRQRRHQKRHRRLRLFSLLSRWFLSS
jgi:carboxyl-terminal processing protease